MQNGNTQLSGPLYSVGVTSASASQGFFVPISPPTAKTDTIQWTVTQHCGPDKVIGSGSCVLCVSATAADSAGLAYIKRQEGPGGRPVLHEYDNDGSEKGNCTIGWGHLVHTGRCVCLDPKVTCSKNSEKPFYKGITKKKAQSLFDQDVQTAAGHVTATSPVDVSQCQMNGLVDWFFNHGNGQNGARINRDLRKGDFLDVSNDIGVYYGTPNPARRTRDRDLLFDVNCQDC